MQPWTSEASTWGTLPSCRRGRRRPHDCDCGLEDGGDPVFPPAEVNDAMVDSLRPQRPKKAEVWPLNAPGSDIDAFPHWMTVSATRSCSWCVTWCGRPGAWRGTEVRNTSPLAPAPSRRAPSGRTATSCSSCSTPTVGMACGLSVAHGPRRTRSSRKPTQEDVALDTLLSMLIISRAISAAQSCILRRAYPGLAPDLTA